MGVFFKLGSDGDISVGNTLYSSCARIVEARLLFEKIPDRTAGAPKRVMLILRNNI